MSALALTQGIGTVVAMQNSIVQVYAEQKNKEVTSQEFLDYINQIKEQNPNFKFSQSETKVFDSEEQALANLAEQRQAINTAISNYKQAVEERNTRYEQEWLALLTEMVKADNVIKRKLAKVLVNKSEFFSRQDKVDSYKIKKTSQGDLIFDVRWQTLANFGDTTQYEYVTMAKFCSTN